MKKSWILFVLGISMAMSCQLNELEIQLTEGETFYASIEDNGVTRTTLDENNNVLWSENDQISIFRKSTINSKYQVTPSSAGQHTGIFTKVYTDDDLHSGFELDHNISIYPYQEPIRLSKSNGSSMYEFLGLTLPKEQSYVKNSFAIGAFPMVAISDNTELTFRNVGGGIKLQLKGIQKITSINIRGNNNEKLSGAATLIVYSNETPPSVAMASDALTSVTLDCGSGIQLNESIAKNFIVSMPPVTFSKGMVVNITDVNNKTYTINTDKANTVSRSSLLVMPVVDLNDLGDDDEPIIPVATVELNYDSYKLYEGDSVQLIATVKPKDATDNNLIWNSDNLSVAVVNQNGLVTAISEGSAVISATAGGQVATCIITVESAMDNKDYIDEYGINHGPGIVIGDVVWAPVNCGYHEDFYQYGKLYQWGRKYGQGYSGNICDNNGTSLGQYSDASIPAIEQGGVSIVTGNSKSKENVFFLGVPDDDYDWEYPHDNEVWNLGTEQAPIKTDYDPCPNGWRVPTSAEFNKLVKNHSSWTTDPSNKVGYWFSGSSSYISSASQVFLPAAGYRRSSDGYATDRGKFGFYWASETNIFGASCLISLSTFAEVFGGECANGYSVRCVQDASSSENYIPVSDIQISQTSLNLCEFETARLSAIVTPSDATYSTVVWSSDTPSVATVDQSGFVEAVSSGIAVISASVGSKVATCIINVSSSGVDGYIDGFDDPENGVVILQKATKGNGTDIVIMGDGFTRKHFVKGGEYENIMKKAYEDFFSIEPYTSLKEYFNVYYINVLSEEDHDAVPYYDYYGNQNGATQGVAITKLETQFTPGSTFIDGNQDVILEYATQAIKAKGQPNGGECNYDEAYNRAHKALVIVLPNVECYAGTCSLAWRSSGDDYDDLYSIAYCALGRDEAGLDRKYILIHEAGGHGFGKLADEYSGNVLTRFNTKEWWNLRTYHKYGVHRNVNEYWTPELETRWSGLDWDYTTESTVYWSDLLSPFYDYIETEELGIYEGANTYSSLFCRPSNNSLMNDHSGYNGQYFNAISRWAIWYRLMRMTQSINVSSFKESLDEFVNFDKDLNIIKNNPNAITRSSANESKTTSSLGTPVLIECEWRGNVLVRL